MHESEKWKWSRSVVSDSSRPHGLKPTRLFIHGIFPGKSTGVGCHLESTENYNSRSGTMMHYMHVPTLQRKEYPFTEGKRKLTWLYIALFIANKESMVFHWLSPCQEGKGIFLLDSAIIIEHKNSSIWSPNSIWSFIYIYIYIFFFFLSPFTFTLFDLDLSLKGSLIKEQVF